MQEHCFSIWLPSGNTVVVILSSMFHFFTHSTCKATSRNADFKRCDGLALETINFL